MAATVNIRELVMTGGCTGCPFKMIVDTDYRTPRCIVTPNNRRVSMLSKRAPKWCPLNTGSVTVRREGIL